MTAVANDRLVFDVSRPRFRFNDGLAVFLTAIVVLSPLPFGSNRPQFWALGAAAVGLLGSVYFLSNALKQKPHRVPLRDVAAMASLLALLCTFLVVQLLPLGGTLPVAGTPSAPTLSLDPGQTWLMVLQILSYGLFYFLLMQVSAKRDRARLVLHIVFAAVVAYAVLALLSLTQWGDTILGLEKWAYPGSATGTFVNRNSFATFLAMGSAAGMALLMAVPAIHDRPASRIIDAGAIIAGLLIIGATLFATSSRMGAASAAGGAVVVFLLGSSKLGGGIRLWITGLLAVAIGAALLLPSFGGGLLERIVAPGGGDGRLEVYSQVWQAILQRPMTGYGGGSFEWAFAIFAQPPLNLDLTWDKAHSTYLQLWFELGLIFGSIPIVLLVLAGWRSLTTLRRSEGNWVLGLAGIGALTVAAIHSLVDFSLEIQANAFLLLALLAVGAAAPETTRTSRDRTL